MPIPQERLAAVGFDQASQQKAIKTSIYYTNGHRIGEPKERDILNGKLTTYWNMYDSPLIGTDQYAVWRDFLSVIPGTESLLEEERPYALRRDTETHLAARAGNIVGLELGGPGSHLFREFTEGFFDETYGATLNDLRSPGRKDWDLSHNHHVVPEINIFTHEGIEQIRSLLPGGQADFIIERMGGPMSENQGGKSYPDNVFVLAQVAREWYSLLREGGIMYAVLPNALARLLKPYLTMINASFGEFIEITIGDSESKQNKVIRLVKRKGAPEDLPLLGLLETVHALEAGN